MRLQNSIKNMKYNTIAQLLSFLTQFISRTAFIHILGKTYLGISGLFLNVLTILSLADLGIGTVLIYSMYEPLAKKDVKKIRELMQMYKKIYNVIALVVFIIGLIITPFIGKIINSDIYIPHIHFIFLLYLLNTVVSYLCIYKISIINADQKNYIVTIYQQIFNILANIAMIGVLYITKSFIFYLITQMLFLIMSNLVLSKKAEKMYPFIKDTKDCKIDKKEKEKIITNTKAMFLHKVGGVVVSGTDSLIISSIISIDVVGIYSNYILIINAIKKFTVQYFNSIIASIGNLSVEKNIEHLKEIFYNVFFGNFIIYTFCASCLYGLINSFINLWLGEDFVFSKIVTLCIVLQFYIDGMRQTTLTFKEAMGIFKQDQFKPICEAIINLVISILFAFKFGMAGVLLGTIISMSFSFVVEAYVLFKYGFKEKTNKYYQKLLKYLIIFIILIIIIGFINQYININNIIIEFVIKFFSTLVCTILFLIITTYKMEEFKYFKNKFININILKIHK